MQETTEGEYNNVDVQSVLLFIIGGSYFVPCEAAKSFGGSMKCWSNEGRQSMLLQMTFNFYILFGIILAHTAILFLNDDIYSWCQRRLTGDIGEKFSLGCCCSGGWPIISIIKRIAISTKQRKWRSWHFSYYCTDMQCEEINMCMKM